VLIFLFLLLLFRKLIEIVSFLLVVAFFPFLTHYLYNSEVASSSNIDNILIQSQNEAGIRYYFSPFFESFIEVGFFIYFYPSIIEGVGEESGKSIFSSILALVMHHVIVVADRMKVNKSALTNAAHPCAVFQPD
jgi:hypothetical protein